MKLTKLWTLFTLLGLVFCWTQDLRALEFQWEKSGHSQIAVNQFYSINIVSHLKSVELQPQVLAASSFLTTYSEQDFLSQELFRLRFDFSQKFRHFRPLARLPWPGAPPLS